MPMAMGIPLSMFLEALGATGVQIGLAVTVQQVAMIVQIPSALIAGRLKTRKRIWAILFFALAVALLAGTVVFSFLFRQIGAPGSAKIGHNIIIK